MLRNGWAGAHQAYRVPVASRHLSHAGARQRPPGLIAAASYESVQDIGDALRAPRFRRSEAAEVPNLHGRDAGAFALRPRPAVPVLVMTATEKLRGRIEALTDEEAAETLRLLDHRSDPVIAVPRRAP